MAKTLVHAGEDVNPACCRCIPTVCAADDSGDHCAEQACGVCLHGCPALDEARCCLLTAGGAP